MCPMRRRRAVVERETAGSESGLEFNLTSTPRCFRIFFYLALVPRHVRRLAAFLGRKSYRQGLSVCSLQDNFRASCIHSDLFGTREIG